MFHIIFLSEATETLSILRKELKKERNRWEIDFTSDLNQAIERIGEKTSLLFADWEDKDSRLEVIERTSETFPHVSTVFFDLGEKRRNSGTGSRFATGDPRFRVLVSNEGAMDMIAPLVEYAELRSAMPSCRTVADWIRDGSLPVTLPKKSAQLFAIIGRGSGAVEQASEVLRIDPNLSHFVVELAKGYDQSQLKDLNIEKAVDVLGLWQVFGIGLIYELFQSLIGSTRTEAGDEPNEDFKQLAAFLHHSISVSRLTKEIADLLPTNNISKANIELSGLLHDVGKFVLLAVAGKEEYSVVRSVAQQCSLHLWQAEKLVWNVCHCEVGALMLDRMGLPLEIVSSVLFHHQPRKEQMAVESPAILLHLSDAIDHFRRKKDEARFLGSIDLGLVKKLKWDGQIENWKHQVLKKRDGALAR